MHVPYIFRRNSNALSPADSSIALVLMGMYEAMGHVIALQYGGSEAHSVFFQRKKGESNMATQSKEMLISLRY